MHFLRPLSFSLPPSSFPIVPLAVPYWSGETYRQVLRCCISGCVVAGPDLAQLRSQIITALGVEHALLCGSGTLALEMALRVCAVQPGDEVVLPAFCCSAVVAPILSVGAIPVLADVGDELNLTAETAAAALTGKTRAIIVPHLFGNPADIEAIVELARARNIRVIDDAAQALGAVIDGRALGSFGDAGILSFGREKVCFGLGGGALVSQDGSLLDRTGGAVMARPGVSAVLGNFVSTLIWRRWRCWSAALPKLFGDRPEPGAPSRPYRHEMLSNLNAAVAVSLVRSLGENIRARRARVEAFQSLLGGDERLELIPHRPGSACLTQVVRVARRGRNHDAASQIIAVLSDAGYEIRGSYVPIHLLGSFGSCVWDRLPCTEQVWADLIELPCEPSVALDEIARIAEIIKRHAAA